MLSPNVHGDTDTSCGDTPSRPVRPAPFEAHLLSLSSETFADMDSGRVRNLNRMDWSYAPALANAYPFDVALSPCVRTKSIKKHKHHTGKRLSHG